MRTQSRRRRSGALSTLAGLAGAAWLVGRVRRSTLPRYSFTGKVVLVTGASRGFGLVLARQFASEGSRLVITARNHEDLEGARADLSALGAEVFSHACDLADRSQVRELFRLAGERFGVVDVLVNNAGTISVAPIEDMTHEDFDEAMASNYWSAVNCTLEAIPDMRGKGEGRILNISSIGGRIPAPHLLPYTASKFALTGFSDGLRAEVMKDGILVTTVYPTMMRTGSHRNAIFKGQNEKEYAWFALSDTLPMLSVSAEWAARAAIEACRYGEAEALLGVPTKLGAIAYGLFPGLTSEGLALVARFLPSPGGIGTARRLGKESRSAVAPPALTVLGEEAGNRNNQPA